MKTFQFGRFLLRLGAKYRFVKAILGACLFSPLAFWAVNGPKIQGKTLRKSPIIPNGNSKIPSPPPLGGSHYHTPSE